MRVILNLTLNSSSMMALTWKLGCVKNHSPYSGSEPTKGHQRRTSERPGVKKGEAFASTERKTSGRTVSKRELNASETDRVAPKRLD